MTLYEFLNKDRLFNHLVVYEQAKEFNHLIYDGIKKDAINLLGNITKYLKITNKKVSNYETTIYVEII